MLVLVPVPGTAVSVALFGDDKFLDGRVLLVATDDDADPDPDPDAGPDDDNNDCCFFCCRHRIMKRRSSSMIVVCVLNTVLVPRTVFCCCCYCCCFSISIDLPPLFLISNRKLLTTGTTTGPS